MGIVDVCDDLRMALENMETAMSRIRTAGAKQYSPDETKEIEGMLRSLFWRALPFFVDGKVQNPIYHNTQVLDNMVRIGIGEKLDYLQFKNATILALLHDIGNAVSRRRKVKTDEVIDRLRSGDVDGGKSLALQAIAFRLEHMDNGPQLAREVLRPFVEDGVLRDQDVHFVCRAIAVHDYPSIEEIVTDVKVGAKTDLGYHRGDFLLPFGNDPFGRLAMWLREADRLFMVSEQGVIKDLEDSGKPVAPESILAKLKSNTGKHVSEFALYKRAGKGKGFRGQTLYRTRTGYALFREFQRVLQRKYGRRRRQARRKGIVGRPTP